MTEKIQERKEHIQFQAESYIYVQWGRVLGPTVIIIMNGLQLMKKHIGFCMNINMK